VKYPGSQRLSAATAIDDPPAQANPAPNPPAVQNHPKLDPNGHAEHGCAGGVAHGLHEKNWCEVSGDQVPNGSGWVWGALEWG
jgi:hypothetical protein